MSAIKKAITIPAILLSLTTVAIAGDSSYENYQLRRLKSPTAKELESEQQGRVYIYDGLKDYHVQMALDEHFDRVESMMFTGVVVTDESNQPKKDSETGEVVTEDDGC